MFKNLISTFLLIFVLFSNNSNADIINSIKVEGNYRVSSDTIIMFSDIKLGTKFTSNESNRVLKNIYDTNFFSDVSINFSEDKLIIKVEELPIIQNIFYEGIKANKIKDKVYANLKLKQRSSYNKIFLKEDKDKIQTALKDLGYYFSKVEISIIELEDNKVDLKYNVNLGKKAKIKKISFIGNKIYKDKKLKRLIISEEYKFWKFISGKKFLNENLIQFDEQLLKNFFLNKGYYNVEVNSSFAKLINVDEFELIYNINANEKFFFGNLNLNLPDDFDRKNFEKLTNLFKDIKGEKYSIDKIDNILEEIDKVTLEEQFESISASVVETLNENNINLTFNIEKIEKLIVEKINILGNNITRENVIRNQFVIDEGDPYNEILANKTINNIKSLRFFKTVNSEVVEGSSVDSRIINISVEEKATGEISAGAGLGSDGASFMVGVKENNYLGKGLKVEANALVREDSIKGILSVTNPNYNNSDKSVYFVSEIREIDRLTESGYKTNRQGFSIGTNFEYQDDFNLGIGTSNYFEKIETNSSASSRQKKQAGNYYDTFLNLNFDFDKRNKKFQTDDGFRSRYFIDLPILSKTYSLANTYNYQYYTELYENNITNFSLFLKSISSITDKDVKLSERVFLPSNKLRGFEFGKVGPKDGNDFIGGNYAAAFNFSSTIPQLFENSQNLDFIFFVDVANIWGVDYDASINDNSKIRSSLGIGMDWLTPIGPVNFTLSETLSKSDTDITESFRFNLGTTF